MAKYADSFLRDFIFWRDEGICGICKEPIDGPFHADHVKPLSKGGKTEPDNLRPAHPFCNQSRGNKRKGRKV